jgi:tetratricopeptide (TPR) repeat protein
MLRGFSIILIVSSFPAFSHPQDSTLPPGRSVEQASAASRAIVSGQAGSADILGAVGSQQAEQFTTWLKSIPQAEKDKPSGIAVDAGSLRHKVPKAARKAFDRAWSFTRKSDIEQAILEFERAIALDPDFVEAHIDLGASYTRVGRLAEAAAQFRRAIELRPRDSLVHSNLAWAILWMGDLQGAERSARRALELSSSNARAHAILGYILGSNPATRAEGKQHLEFAARTIPDAKLIMKVLFEN